MPVSKTTEKLRRKHLLRSVIDREGLAYGINRIHLYYSHVEGKWFDTFNRNESQVDQGIDNFPPQSPETPASSSLDTTTWNL
jgi:hypothetical protein